MTVITNLALVTVTNNHLVMGLISIINDENYFMKMSIYLGIADYGNDHIEEAPKRFAQTLAKQDIQTHDLKDQCNLLKTIVQKKYYDRKIYVYVKIYFHYNCQFKKKIDSLFYLKV